MASLAKGLGPILCVALLLIFCFKSILPSRDTLLEPLMQPSTTNAGHDTRVQSLLECYAQRQCETRNFDTPGWLTPGQICLLNCLGRTADSTVVEQGVFAGKSTLHIAAGLRAAGRDVKLLSHDIFPTTVCEDQPFCWDCGDHTCTLKILDDSPYSMPRAKFDQDRRHLMSKYGSFEKWVLAKLHQYGLLGQVYIISSRTLVPGEFKYLWLDTTHSCKEIEMNTPAILASSARDAVFLVHDMDNDENLQCLLKALGRTRARLVVDGLAVV